MKSETVQMYSLAFTWNTAQLKLSHLHPLCNNHRPGMTIMPDYSSQVLPSHLFPLTPTSPISD